MNFKRGGKIYVGYALGNCSEACIYNFVTSFFMIYLTGTAGINAHIAGTITSISLLFETVASIIIGRISDRTVSKYGRRRPYILIAAVLAPISIFAMFNNLNMTLSCKIGYYIVSGIFFWILYSVFYIPYTALGAEIAKGYDERTKLRSIARGFGLIGTLLGLTLPLLVTQFFQKHGLKNSEAWNLVAIIIGLICFLGYFFCWNFTRDGETKTIYREEQNKVGIIMMLQDMFELLSLKTMRIALIYKIFFTCGFTFFSASTIFFLRYNLQLKNGVTSTIYIISVVISLILTPFISNAALRLGKKKQQTVAMFFSGICGIVLYITGIRNYITTVIFVMIFSFAQTSFWQLSNAIFYDITEIDEFVYEKRREGDISCIQSVVGTLVTAGTIQLLGIFLEMAHFEANSSVQGSLAMSTLSIIFILLPSVSLILAGIAISMFPVTRTRFETLLKVLILRQEGKDYQCYMNELNPMIK